MINPLLPGRQLFLPSSAADKLNEARRQINEIKMNLEAIRQRRNGRFPAKLTSYHPPTGRYSWIEQDYDAKGIRYNKSFGLSGDHLYMPALPFGDGTPPPAYFPIDVWMRQTIVSPKLGPCFEFNWSCPCGPKQRSSSSSKSASGSSSGCVSVSARFAYWLTPGVPLPTSVWCAREIPCVMLLRIDGAISWYPAVCPALDNTTALMRYVGNSIPEPFRSSLSSPELVNYDDCPFWVMDKSTWTGPPSLLPFWDIGLVLGNPDVPFGAPKWGNNSLMWLQQSIPTNQMTIRPFNYSPAMPPPFTNTCNPYFTNFQPITYTAGAGSFCMNSTGTTTGFAFQVGEI